MKNKQNPYHFLNTFCFRAPLFSLDFYQKLTRKPFFDFEDFKLLWNNPTIKEALFLASPELCSELEKCSKKETPETFEKLKHSFFKYVIRSSTRCTPFGLFSGVGVGCLGEKSNITLKEVSKHKRLTEFDTNYLFNLSNHLLTIDEIRKQSLFYPNSSLYKIANQYRYIEYQIHNTKPSYSIEATESNPYLEAIFLESKTGKTFNQLVAALVELNISEAEAEGYITTLIDHQILISELALNVTGDNILSQLINTLKRFKNIDILTHRLTSLQKDLKRLDESIGNPKKAYDTILETLHDMNILFDSKYLFQTDLSIQSSQNTLDKKHGYNLKKIIPFLITLNPYQEKENLKQFKKAFRERYESREVPLSLAIDIETGIGYVQKEKTSNTTPFLDDITPTTIDMSNTVLSLDAADHIVYKKFIEAQKNKTYTIELKDVDFEQLDCKWEHLPDTFAAFIDIVDLNSKETIILNSMSNSAGKLLGRFCHGDTTIENHVKNITEIEQLQNPDKILAEIVHLPESRIGNILKRPHLRAYEIPFLAQSTLPKSQQIPIDDLYLSLKFNRIVLTSKKLNKEIVPKLTNAHYINHKALPIYRFLCDLESQNTRQSLNFFWPKILDEFTFLPRVVYKNIILSKARWKINEDLIKKIAKCENDSALKNSIIQWKNTYNIPQYIQIVERDNTLLIDTTHIESIKLFKGVIKSKKAVIIEEFLAMDTTTIKKKEEYFRNQFILSFFNQQKLDNI